MTIAKGAEAKAKEINPNVKVLAVSADYDLNKRFTQIDNFIASGVDTDPAPTQLTPGHRGPPCARPRKPVSR